MDENGNIVITYTDGTVEILEHSWVYAFTLIAATCTEKGIDLYSCETCSVLRMVTTNAYGHTESVDAAILPDCTNTGLTEGKHCEDCGEVLVAQKEVEALGHTEVIDEAVVPTCITTGLTEGKHCSECNEVLVAQEEVEALGHTEVIDEAVAPTCITTGLTEGKHCYTCNYIIQSQNIVNKEEHVFVNGRCKWCEMKAPVVSVKRIWMDNPGAEVSVGDCITVYVEAEFENGPDQITLWFASKTNSNSIKSATLKPSSTNEYYTLVLTITDKMYPGDWSGTWYYISDYYGDWIQSDYDGIEFTIKSE